MKSHEVLSLLERRHDKDVFFREVSNGPSGRKDYGRLDAWAMRCSYTRPMTWGYEVKVSRSDFLRDEKWQNYLAVCNSLSFVCPHGIIQSEEVPESCGLIWVASTGSRLATKRKAPTRDVKIPDVFWRSLAMNKMRPTVSDVRSREERVAEARKHLETLREGREIGWQIGYLLAQRVHGAERKNEALQRRVEKLEECQSLLRRLGISNDYDPMGALLRRIESEAFGCSLENIEHRLRVFLQDIEMARENFRSITEEN